MKYCSVSMVLNDGRMGESGVCVCVYGIMCAWEKLHFIDGDRHQYAALLADHHVEKTHLPLSAVPPRIFARTVRINKAHLPDV